MPCQVRAHTLESAPHLLPSLVPWKVSWRAPSRSPINKVRDMGLRHSQYIHGTHACCLLPFTWSPLLQVATQVTPGNVWFIVFQGPSSKAWEEYISLGLLSHISHKARQWSSTAGQQHVGRHKLILLTQIELLNQGRPAFNTLDCLSTPRRGAAIATSTVHTPQRPRLTVSLSYKDDHYFILPGINIMC